MEITELQKDLAATFRWTARLNMHEGVANHFSACLPGSSTDFYVNKAGVHFSQIKASDLILVTKENINDLKNKPELIDPTAINIHGTIHQKVPHAKCIFHVHSKYATALSTLKNPTLPPIDQNTMIFYNRVSIFNEFGGLGFENESIKMATALGNKQHMLLANHGIITTGETVAEGFNYLYEIPHNKGISTADFWNKGVDWIWDTFFQTLKIFNTWLIVDVLQPMRAAYLRMPIVATFVLVMGAGYIIGGIRSAFVVGALTLFIALSPWWDRALVTLYMATFGVFISTIIGFTVGALCFQNKYTTNFMLGVCDIFQTFPSFVYLIPVMMLFGVTDTSVLIAVVVYATIPATRYTIEGLRSVPVALHDAATMSGVTKLQRLSKIEFPLAFPHMMLGLNQTIVFALFMVIIGAFIGTEDLGQYILKAISDKKGAGIGLTLGICVAFIGLVFDHLIRTWVGQRKKHLGID